jgi:hypothetical protein
VRPNHPNHTFPHLFHTSFLPIPHLSTPIPHLSVDAELANKTRANERLCAFRKPHLKTQKNRPKGRLCQKFHTCFAEVLRTLTGEVEPVNPPTQKRAREHLKGVGTQGCQHSFCLSVPLPHRVAAPHPAPLAVRGASGEDRHLSPEKIKEVQT